MSPVYLGMPAEGLRLARNICTATFRQGPSSIVFKEAKVRSRPRVARSRNIPMASAAASRASPALVPKNSSARHTPVASRWLCRSFSAKPNLRLSKWKPQQKSRSTRWPTAYAITAVHLNLKAKVPGADQTKIQELAGKAKAGCPVSKLMNAKIALDATLVDV